jgi:cupin fold WbuC family metalloprotein
MHPIEIISDGATPLAYIVRAGWMPESTKFLTPDHFGQQMGMIVYGAGTSIQPHLHLPVVREVHGTTECIVVRKGACELDIYDQSKQLIESRFLKMGDIVLLLGGGHGFRMSEDTVLFEVKQGPYVEEADKERF